MSSSSAQQQAALDRVSLMIADMDHDVRMVTCVNAFVLAHDSDNITVISSLAQLMGAMASAIEGDELKLRVACAFRDLARLTEESTKSGKVRH